MNLPLRIRRGDCVQHIDGRMGECIGIITPNMAGYPIAIIRWMNGGEERVELGYIQKVPDFSVV